MLICLAGIMLHVWWSVLGDLLRQGNELLFAHYALKSNDILINLLIMVIYF